MLQFPPMPTWVSLHPLIIHFPIVLLLLCPIFILIGAILSPPRGRPYMSAALLILVLGTASLFISVASGRAAAELVERQEAFNAVLQSHEELASETRILFTSLSLIFIGVYALPGVFRRGSSRLFSTLLPLAFLVFYTVGILFLVNTAHSGGRLVHEFGVHALLPSSDDQTASSAALTEDRTGE